MAAEVRVYLVRHAETEWNQMRRFQGQKNPPLSSVGKLQARQVAERLAESGATYIVSSDLMRARMTAEIIGERLGLPVVTSPLWRERRLGRWEGLTREEVKFRYPGEWEAVHAHPAGAGILGGESLVELEVRAASALDELVRHYRDQTGIVVSHGGLLRQLLARLCGISPDRRHSFFLDNAGVSTLFVRSEKEIYVYSLNETFHLRSL